MLKKSKTSAIAALAFLFTVLGLSSCTRDMCEVTMTYTKYTPVYMSYEELRSPDAVKSEAPRDLKNPGKIYIKDQYLYVNEFRKGIHVIDNSNPSAPQKIAFISIPGNKDIAVYGSVMYADSHVDLITIDISNPASPVVTGRQENVLPYDTYENYTSLDPTLGVVNEWLEEEVTETAMVDCNNTMNQGPMMPFEGNSSVFGGGASGGGNKNPMTAGKGGSMARFAIVDHYLYVVGESDMQLFDITNGGLVFSNTLYLGNGIETIFPYEEKLFIGTTTGMQIYDNSNPTQPFFLGSFWHVTSCDPVVVTGNRAYVTLRGGTPCGNNDNELHVVDISTPTNPMLTASYGMEEPYGLGTTPTNVYVCDGAGVKVYHNNTADDLELVNTLNTGKAYDLIPHENILYVVSEDGLIQFDYTNGNSPSQLSRIPVVK